MTFKDEKKMKRMKRREKERKIRRHELLGIPLPKEHKNSEKKNYLIIIRCYRDVVYRRGRRYRNYVFVEGDKRMLKDMKKNHGLNVIYYEERKRTWHDYKEIDDIGDVQEYIRYIEM